MSHVTSPKIMHLKRVDEKILSLWIDADGNLNSTQTRLFLALLEKRVQLLKVLREAGEKLHPSLCVPPWLEKFSRSTQSVSLRDLKVALEETRRFLEK